MKKLYIASLTGYDNSEWHSIVKEIEIEASSLDEARELARQWCDENSHMWTYEYYVDYVKEKSIEMSEEIKVN